MQSFKERHEKRYKERYKERFRQYNKYIDYGKLCIAALPSLFLYVISVIILGRLYSRFQLSLFKSSEDILLIYNTSLVSGAIPIGMLIVCFICGVRIYSGKNKFTIIKLKISYLLVGLVIFLCTLIIATLDIFIYTKVNDDGFVIKRSILAESEFVDWNYVDIARVECKSGTEERKDKMYFSYYILLKNGEEINLKASRDFRNWDKVLFLDKYIEDKGVKVERDRIDGTILRKLVDEYKMDYEEHTEQVIKRIFRYGTGFYTP